MKIKCQTCGSEFEFNKYQPNKRFCSSKCMRKIPDPIAHFWSRCEKLKNGCWRWIGSLNNKGYGQLGVPGGKLVLAHRHAWELANGKIPDGMKVLHNCPSGDNPACINPAHLWLGSMQDNTQDALKKGRLVTGRDHPLHKLTTRDVLTIAGLSKRGKTQRELAIQFGVSPSTVHKILHGKMWGCMDIKRFIDA